ncbi:putative bifunctional diguanylate cyclase/phosphodiesterase [Pontibacillus litoralis]|uniref:Diguanylate cyclase n=1 Tax=Pontibacillus litoralis JSM 072002 TaxID=1385512 RepID=A0A0A5HUC0_9BACI|nr:bifunctional diguanylate cyclase/phosphodiesterase [Pontibacillus litoralis]KGX87242.1 hypothetical protein N784_16205 [Pontibacillus litoralis JSM 072002]
MNIIAWCIFMITIMSCYSIVIVMEHLLQEKIGNRINRFFVGVTLLTISVSMMYAIKFNTIQVGFPVLITFSLLLQGVLAIGVWLSKKKNDSVDKLSNYDRLTTLPNRSSFFHRYDEIIHRAHEEKLSVICILFDVDHVMWINETFGRRAGDELLKKIAGKLQRCSSPNAFVARIGGNRFGYVCYTSKIALNVKDYLVKMQESVNNISFSQGQFTIQPTISIGASVATFDTNQTEDLFICAERALHFAKEKGRNNGQVYDPAIHYNEREHQILLELKQAIKREEFTLYFQPLVTEGTFEVNKAETLLRWNSEQLGHVSPAEFIPVAEKYGLIVDITEWVICSAFQQLNEWDKAHYIIQSLSINISSVHFQYGDVSHMMEKLATQFDIDPTRIEIEITETSVMKNIDEAVQALHKLRALGFRVALDDFGTGLSSLNYLQQLPIDNLKIDRSFVQHIDQDNKKQVIVETIIRLAQHLGAEVTVEGVETKQEVDFLQASGCNYLQGYYFSKPLPVKELMDRYQAKGLV